MLHNNNYNNYASIVLRSVLTTVSATCLSHRLDEITKEVDTAKARVDELYVF